jgi:hypothetical protein
MAADEILFVADHDGCRFEIQAGRGEGYYVWRIAGNRSTHDYLQDDIAAAKRCALRQWGVPDTAWRPAMSSVPGTPRPAGDR